MSDHRPVLSGYRVVEHPETKREYGQNQARCACGWRGEWFADVRECDHDLHSHLQRCRFDG